MPCGLRRRDVALRLLESLGVVDDEAVEGSWTWELACRVDDVVRGEVTAVPGEQLFAHIAARRAAPGRITLALGSTLAAHRTDLRTEVRKWASQKSSSMVTKAARRFLEV